MVASRHRFLAMITLAELLVFAGCGSEVPVYPASGKVVYKSGGVVTGGSVIFESLDHEPKRNARGKIQPDGTFRLGTLSSDDGALTGRHRVVVFPPMRANPRTSDISKGLKPIASPIARKYKSFDRSGLEFTVEPGENVFTVEVERP